MDQQLIYASGDNEVHQVHGLTTAASVWLSAAAGVGAGGAEYFVSTYAVRKVYIKILNNVLKR